jgi:hypothetical protein
MIEYMIIGVFLIEILVFLRWCQSGQRMNIMWKRCEGDHP